MPLIAKLSGLLGYYEFCRLLQQCYYHFLLIDFEDINSNKTEEAAKPGLGHCCDSNIDVDGPKDCSHQ